MPDQEISQDKIELVGAFRECGAILAAIGDENRQRILTALIEKPGLRVEEIREYTDLSRPAVSHHLKILKDAEAISVLKLGTKNYYFPGCESDIWRKLNALTGEICSLAASQKTAVIGTAQNNYDNYKKPYPPISAAVIATSEQAHIKILLKNNLL